jgi:hypothetical protein
MCVGTEAKFRAAVDASVAQTSVAMLVLFLLSVHCELQKRHDVWWHDNHTSSFLNLNVMME